MSQGRFDMDLGTDTLGVSLELGESAQRRAILCLLNWRQRIVIEGD
jgi:hypothetical protein